MSSNLIPYLSLVDTVITTDIDLIDHSDCEEPSYEEPQCDEPQYEEEPLAATKSGLFGLLAAGAVGFLAASAANRPTRESQEPRLLREQLARQDVTTRAHQRDQERKEDWRRKEEAARIFRGR
jgi:hypothetical protein